jgi:hypothetical protein
MQTPPPYPPPAACRLRPQLQHATADSACTSDSIRDLQHQHMEPQG